MSDCTTIVMALAAAGGAWAAWPAPAPLALAAVGLAFAGRSAVLLVVGVALLTGTLAARSWAGLHPPRQRTFEGTVTLVGDPAPVDNETRVEVRIGIKRVEAWAHGRNAQLLADRLAGERVALAGRLEPVPASSKDRLAARHIAARMSVDRVGSWTVGDPASRLANGVRRTLARGAESLSPSKRSLFLGFVLGDDRGQSPEVVDDFRGAGLTHLLVVSGENLAFVLALAGPLLRRLALGGRLTTVAVILLFFGLLTRWEPSVLRAVAMVAVSMLAWAVGRPSSTVRLLALAVTALLLIDPLLVHSVGFLLSVGACAGIAVLAKPIAEALPGPRPIADALGVTAAAQLGVAPVLVPVFGGLPVASLVANLLAVPAAGPVMMWGIAAGLPAGLAGGVVARAVCLPTGLLIGWIASVARWSAAAPLGHLALAHVIVLGVIVAAGVVLRSRKARAVLLAAAVLVLAQPAVALAAAKPVSGREVVPGARLWRSQASAVLVVDNARADQLLRSVHAAGVRTLDVVVLTTVRRPTTTAVATMLTRVPVRVVAAPPGVRFDGRQIVIAEGEIAVGSLVVHMRPAPADTVEVEVARR